MKRILMHSDFPKPAANAFPPALDIARMEVRTGTEQNSRSVNRQYIWKNIYPVKRP